MKKGILYIILFLIIILINIITFTFFKDTTFEEQLTLINTLYIITVYFVDKIVENFNEKELNKKYWFKTFILEKYIFDYCNFFEEGISILREANIKKAELVEANLQTNELILESEKLNSKYFDKFSIAKRKITSINSFIQIYDNKLYLKVQKVIEKYQDKCTKVLDEIINNVTETNVEKEVNDIYEIQNELLGIFYNHSIGKK